MPRVLLVSNRLPVTLSVTEGGLIATPSSGGLATAMGSVHGQGGSLWFGWPGPVGETTPEALDRALDPHRCIAVHVSAQEVSRYYDGFSNGVLWPLCHYLLDKLELDAHENWDAFVAVNERFADRVLQYWRPGDLIWVHDYQLALVPAMLRRKCPEARIGFFLHVPFPSVEVFRILPWREQILRGLLGADVIGFHTASYAYHFSYSCSQLLGLELTGDVLYDDGRPVQVAAFPIGIDVHAFEERAALPSVRERAEVIRAEAGGRTIALSVDRLDYTKGLVRRFRALNRLLTDYPDLRDKLHVIQLGIPTRENVDAYADYRKVVNEEIGRFNGAFSTATRNVAHFMHRSVTPEELSALYLAADVMLVTPLRDGMNLVAKEYVASRIGDTGALVLSEFAGAATELHEAVQVNPYDLAGMVDAILSAVTMPLEEQKVRMAALRQTVRGTDVQIWASGFVSALAESPSLPAAAPISVLEAALGTAVKAPKLVLVLDYDGTLVSFTRSPRTASPDPELVELLQAISQRPNTTVHVVSGRSRESLEAFLGEFDLGLHAEHGLWSRMRRGDAWKARVELPPSWMEAVRPLMKAVVRRTNGAFLEEKSGALAFHYRSTEPQLSQRRAAELRAALEKHPLASAYEVLDGARVLEVRQRGMHKGVVVPSLLEGNAGAAVIAIGDDRTDEDLFLAMPPEAMTIHVGSGQSHARFRLTDVNAVRELLKRLARTTA
jgi:trehalose 6-phosphate synthase/phosphatase